MLQSKADKKLREVLFSFVSARLETVRDCAVEEVTQRVRGRLVEGVVLLMWGGGVVRGLSHPSQNHCLCCKRV